MSTGSSKASAARIYPRCFAALCAVGALTLTGAGQAKLPAPTPEQVAAAEATAQKAKEQAAVEQAALARAQDRTVAVYQSDLKKRGITPPTPTPVATTPQANLPAKAVEPPRTAGPHGGNTPSAEAHSGNAR
jgi:hypothetical protein